MTLRQTLDKWAKELCDKASQKDTSFQESIDAFKAVAAYHRDQAKDRRKPGEDEPPEDGGFTFGSEHGGSSKVPGRRDS